MSKENKVIDLKDEVLANVSGGYTTKTLYTFEEGECYNNTTSIYKVLHYHEDLDIDKFVDCCEFDKHTWVTSHKKTVTKEKTKIHVYDLINMDYEGINII